MELAEIPSWLQIKQLKYYPTFINEFLYFSDLTISQKAD
jgi:hypothetical protein